MPARIPRPWPAFSLDKISCLVGDGPPEGSSAPTPIGDPMNSEPSPKPPFLSLRDSADWLCVSLSTLKRLIAKGTLSTLRVGARRKIPATVLAAYMARHILLPDQVQDNEF